MCTLHSTYQSQCSCKAVCTNELTTQLLDMASGSAIDSVLIR